MIRWNLLFHDRPPPSPRLPRPRPWGPGGRPAARPLEVGPAPGGGRLQPERTGLAGGGPGLPHGAQDRSLATGDVGLPDGRNHHAPAVPGNGAGTPAAPFLRRGLVETVPRGWPDRGRRVPVPGHRAGLRHALAHQPGRRGGPGQGERGGHQRGQRRQRACPARGLRCADRFGTEEPLLPEEGGLLRIQGEVVVHRLPARRAGRGGGAAACHRGGRGRASRRAVGAGGDRPGRLPPAGRPMAGQHLCPLLESRHPGAGRPAQVVPALVLPSDRLRALLRMVRRPAQRLPARPVLPLPSGCRRRAHPFVLGPEHAQRGPVLERAAGGARGHRHRRQRLRALPADDPLPRYLQRRPARRLHLGRGFPDEPSFAILDEHPGGRPAVPAVRRAPTADQHPFRARCERLVQGDLPGLGALGPGSGRVHPGVACRRGADEGRHPARGGRVARLP